MGDFKESDGISKLEMEGNVINLEMNGKDYSFMKGTWFEDDTEKGEQYKIIIQGTKDASAPVCLFLKMGNPTAKEIKIEPDTNTCHHVTESAANMGSSSQSNLLPPVNQTKSAAFNEMGSSLV